MSDAFSFTCFDESPLTPASYSGQLTPLPAEAESIVFDTGIWEVEIDIPQGTGKLPINSRCGEWFGEMMIVDDEILGRCVKWAALYKKPEKDDE